MPWDATELRVTAVDATSSKSSDHELIAGSDGDTSIIQPLWHPKTGDLYYISDQSGYYNIYRAGHDQAILPMESDFGGASTMPSCGRPLREASDSQASWPHEVTRVLDCSERAQFVGASATSL